MEQKAGLNSRIASSLRVGICLSGFCQSRVSSPQRMSKAHLFPRGSMEVIGSSAAPGRSVSKCNQTKNCIAQKENVPQKAPPEQLYHEYENNLKKQIYFLELEVKYLKEKMRDHPQDTVVVHVQTAEERHLGETGRKGVGAVTQGCGVGMAAQAAQNQTHDFQIPHSEREDTSHQKTGAPPSPKQPTPRFQQLLQTQASTSTNVLQAGASVATPMFNTSPTPRDLALRNQAQHVPAPMTISGVTPRPPLQNQEAAKRLSTADASQRQLLSARVQTSARNPLSTNSWMQTTPREQVAITSAGEGEIDLEHLVALDVTIRALKDEFLQREQEYQLVIEEMRSSSEKEIQEREEQWQRTLDDMKATCASQVEALEEEKQQERERLTGEIVGLQRKLENELRQVEFVQAELAAVTRNDEERKAENLQLKDSVKALELQLEVSKLQQRKLEADLQNTRSELYSSKTVLQEFHRRFGTDETQDVVTMRQEIKDLEAEVRRQEILIQKLQREKTQDADYKTRLEEDIRKHLEAQVDHQQNEAKLEKTKTQWVSKCESLELAIKEGETARDAQRMENDALKADLDRLRLEHEKVCAQLETERKSALELEAQLQTAKTKIEHQSAALVAAESNFTSIDNTNGDLRTHNRLLVDEIVQLKQTIAQTKERCQFLETESNAMKRQISDLQRQVVLAQGIRDLQLSQAQFEHLLTSNLKVAENIHHLMNTLPTAPDIAATSATLATLVRRSTSPAPAQSSTTSSTATTTTTTQASSSASLSVIPAPDASQQLSSQLLKPEDSGNQLTSSKE